MTQPEGPDEVQVLINRRNISSYGTDAGTPPGETGVWEFERLKTLPTAYFLIVLNVIMIGLVFLIPGICQPIPDSINTNCTIDPLSSLIYSHAVYWLSHLFADQYLKYWHKMSRCKGYIEFYLATKNLRRTPFYMVSIGNAFLLITYTILHDYCDSSPSNCPDKFLKVDYLRGLITLECMIIAFIWVKYIVNVRKFHAKSQKPDMYRKDFVETICPENFEPVSMIIEPSVPLILETQAELIRCMHDYLCKLEDQIKSPLEPLSSRRDVEHQ